MQNYNIESIPLNINGGTIEVNCPDVTWINYGTAILVVNGIRIPPPVTAGQCNVFLVAGNANEQDITKYQYQFSGAGTRDAILVKRNYAR